MKKAISIFTALTTILWLSGVAMVLPARAVTLVDGDVAREADEFDVYIIKIVGDKKFKRLILNPDVFNMYGHLKWENVKVVPDGTLDDYTTSTLVREVNDTKVYKLYPDGDTGTKKWVESLDCFNSQGFDWDSVYIINSFDRDSYTTASETLCGGEGEVSEGELTLSLASDTPAAASVPNNAQALPFLKVKIDGSGTITQMTFKRVGVGEADDFDNVYLYEGDTRLTSGRSISSSTSKVTFIGLSIEAPTTITLVADLDSSNADSGNINAFSLESASDVVADATVGGSFPITGNSMTITSVTGGTLTVASSGSLSNPTVGQQNAQISQFKITADNEPIDIYRIALYNGGTMNSTEITNLELKDASGNVLATADACSSDDLCTFVFDSPYRIGKGESEIFKVYADLGGEKDDTIELYFEVSADIKGVGATYGHTVYVNIGSFDSASDAHSLTLEGGELTIAFNGPTAADISNDTNDTVMMEFSFTAAADLEIRKMKVYICWNDSDGGEGVTTVDDEITDVKLKDKDTGTILMGPTDGTGFTWTDGTPSVCDSSTFGDGEGYKEWTDMWDISAGETKNLQLTLDVDTGTTSDTDGLESDDKIGMLIYGFENLTNPVKYAGTNDYVSSSDIVPSTNIEGNAMTIKVPSISVALASLPTGAVDGVKGQTGVEAMGILFTAGTASDMTLTDLVLTGYVADETIGSAAAGIDSNEGSDLYAKNVVTNISLYEDDGTTLIAGPKGLTDGTNDSEVTFDDLSWDIPAGTTKKMIVKVDITTTATSGTYDYVYFDIDATTDVTALDSEGNSRNPSSVDLQTEDSPTVYVKKSDGGSLTVAAAASGIRPESTYVYMGQTSVPFSKFKFTATDEAFKIDKLTIEIDDSADRINVAKVELEYPIDAAGTLVSTRPVGYFGGTASITFDLTGKEMYVPKDDYAYLTVYADIADYDQIGDQSADNWSLDFEGDGTTTFHAVGEGSSKVIEANATGIADADGQTMYLYRVFPTFTLDGPAAATGATMATRILEFTITNNGDYDLVFNSTSGELKFDVLGSGAGSGNATFTLYKSDGTQVDAATVTTAGGGSASATFDFTDTTITIPAGGSQSFYIEITSGKTIWDENGDWLQLKLQDEADVVKWVDGSDTDQIGLTAGLKNLGIPMIGPEFSVQGL